MEGVEYVGSVSQVELAAALKGAMVLAYPNTFAETSCISGDGGDGGGVPGGDH